MTTLVALLAAFALVLAGCGGDQPGEDKEDITGAVKAGGIFRMETDGFEWTNSFDPTGEYLGLAFMFYSNLLLRTLVGYRHVDGPEGNEVIPDLAEALPEISADGKTYTFKIKQGVKFGRPVNRQITSKDVAYAFERIGTKSLAAQYGFYYEPVVEGLVEFKDGKSDTITGIETPDDRTIVFRLKKPAGDFLFMLAMPAAAPVPEEVGKCFKKAGEYGRYLIASGPYELKGADELDVSSCDTMKPISGFDPTSHLRIVRNPNYDANTDTKEARENFIDGVNFELNTNTEDIFNRIEAGEVDGESAAPPAPVLQKYSSDPQLQGRLKSNPGDRTWYITMTLNEPPFDDIHVRKAVNLVMDKEGLLRVWGGPIRGQIAEHTIPPDVLSGRLKAGEFDPFGPNHAGDVEKAKAEMKQSKYDTDKDGVCDAKACKNIRHITRNTPPQKDMAPVIEKSLEQIGITLDTRPSENAYPIIQEPKNRVPIASNAGWGKDYADASTFAVLFDGRNILETGNTNYSLVGLTREKAREIGVPFREGIPSVDADIDRCSALQGDERITCWSDLDKKLMNEVVPWVPYLWATNIDVISDAVTKYEYDQFSGEPALAHFALDQTKQK